MSRGEEEKKGKRGRRSWSPSLLLHHHLEANGDDNGSDDNRQQLGKETGQHNLGRTRLLVMTKMEA